MAMPQKWEDWFKLNNGKKIFHWTMIGEPKKNTRHIVVVECKCDCGYITDVLLRSLRLGLSTRCKKCALKARQKALKDVHRHNATIHDMYTRIDPFNYKRIEEEYD